MVLSKRQNEEFQLFLDLVNTRDFWLEMLRKSTAEEEKEIFSRKLEQARKALNDFIDDKILE